MISNERLDDVVQDVSVQDSYRTTESNSANKQYKKSGFGLNAVTYLTLTAMAVVIGVSSGCVSTRQSTTKNLSKYTLNQCETPSQLNRSLRKCENYAKERAFLESGLTPGPYPLWSLDGFTFTVKRVNDVRFKNAKKTPEQTQLYYKLVEKYTKECMNHK